jgi:hypothetical protein
MKHKDVVSCRAHDIVEGIGIPPSLVSVNENVHVEFHKHEGVVKSHPISRIHKSEFAMSKHDEAIKGNTHRIIPDYKKKKKVVNRPYKKQVIKKVVEDEVIPKVVSGTYDSLVDDEKKFVVIDLRNNDTIEGVIIKLK